jgi:type I restriction enzyme M protein
MEKNFKDYLQEFDTKYSTIEKFDNSFYKREIWVESFISKASSKDSKWSYSEEYIRARFVFAMVNSWMYNKEYICVEFGFPKWNTKMTLNPDVAVFKDKSWVKELEKAKSSKDYKWFRKNTLIFFETKKDNKSVESAIENQLRSAMAENESEDRVFWVYFDNQDGLLIFKKIWNSEIRRFYENKELHLNGINWLWLNDRDLFIELPSQEDFIENNESISDLTKLKTNNLDAIDEFNMNHLKRAYDKIKPKNSDKDLIVEFLTLKVFDEKRSKKENRYLDFYILDEEEKNIDWKMKVFRERMILLYKEAKRAYSKVLSEPFFKYDKDLKPSSTNDEKFLIELVKIFQRKAILKSKNESFNQIIFNNFWSDSQKADKWQFFTPIPIVKTIIKILNPIKWEELCDPCSGICDFLAMGFRYSHRNDEEYPDNASHYYGFDLEKWNLKLAELNLVLNWDWWAVLQNMDSLSQKLLDKDYSPLKEWLFSIDNFDKETWEPLHNPDLELKKFKIIATNPPFWKWRDLKTWAKSQWDLPKTTLDLYETWKEKSKKDDGSYWDLANSMDMGVLFLENAYKLLEEWGRMGIVLSNSIASIKEWESVRAWFISKVRIVALFDLPGNTFWETWVATTVIIAYKPTKKEILDWILDQNYEVFVKEIENIGYEVKTIDREIKFKPTYIIDEKTFENTNELLEDFSSMHEEFKEFLQRQEEEIKKAFNLDKLD